jgi:outer membrane protein assembly factor BamC
MHNVIRFRFFLAAGSALGLLGALTACSSLDSVTQGDKVDYRSNSRTTSQLVVPPDLTQLSRDPRYQAPTGPVSANTYQATISAAAPATPVVAPTAIENVRIERAGNQRWLVTTMSPEQLWPQLRAFWQDRGFKLVTDDAAAGVMETDWAENRAKLPQDLIRRTLGKILDPLYSTGETDKFRTRVERTPTGSEIYVSHRGMEEVFVTPLRDQTRWQPRPSDPQLEGELLSRVMTKLTTKEGDAKTATANNAAATAIEQPSRARVLADAPGAAMQMDETFDRAWRRVGLALDRSGFTVEDRDRSNGLYYVRYIDPSRPQREEPGFFRRLFSGSAAVQPPERYRIAVKAGGDNATTVSVLDAKGAPEAGDVGKRIVSLLVDELR